MWPSGASWYQQIAFMVLISLLSGCASWIAPSAPDVPTSTVISQRVLDLQKVGGSGGGGSSSSGSGASNGSSSGGPITPADYAVAGYSIADEACSKYFDALTQATNDIDMNKADLTAAGAAAATIMALAKLDLFRRWVGRTLLGSVFL